MCLYVYCIIHNFKNRTTKSTPKKKKKKTTQRLNIKQSSKRAWEAEMVVRGRETTHSGSHTILRFYDPETILLRSHINLAQTWDLAHDLDRRAWVGSQSHIIYYLNLDHDNLSCNLFLSKCSREIYSVHQYKN